MTKRQSPRRPFPTRCAASAGEVSVNCIAKWNDNAGFALGLGLSRYGEFV
jgi:hypothetical protein